VAWSWIATSKNAVNRRLFASVSGGREERFEEESGVQELESLLAASSAAETFKEDVRAFCAGRQSSRIRVNGFVPPVKVRRLLKFVLHRQPELAIEGLSLRGASGCSDFVGVVELETGGERRAFEFVWDCRWRAQEEGWVDYFGLPDQIRAAREFDWQCFKVWSARS
jgi:hypothetical protein